MPLQENLVADIDNLNGSSSERFRPEDRSAKQIDLIVNNLSYENLIASLAVSPMFLIHSTFSFFTDSN